MKFNDLACKISIRGANTGAKARNLVARLPDKQVPTVCKSAETVRENQVNDSLARGKDFRRQNDKGRTCYEIHQVKTGAVATVKIPECRNLRHAVLQAKGFLFWFFFL